MRVRTFLNTQKYFLKQINLLAVGSILIALGTFSSCQNQSQSDVDPLFETIDAQDSGIGFVNRLEANSELNIFKYLYFYNGAGVAAGDLNGDELPDLYFTANQGSNKLYLNQGDLKFKDITEISGVEGDTQGWTTGVTMADVNADGRLDIYVSNLGNFAGIFGKNELFINQGNNEENIPQFKEMAAEYGLDLVGFATQAAFFDYDRDGDLDMYMLNHSVHSNGTFERRTQIRDEKHRLAGDRLMRNDEGKYVDVSDEAGIYSSALGYGLGISTGDLNNDGWPDIYIGNDFHENDYLYLNQKDGTFKEVIQSSMAHTSRFSMGNDFGDLNGDGLLDIISLDMLPGDYEILKASAAEDPYDVYNYKLRYGYNHQFSRNTLQVNVGKGKFSERGLMAGLSATDWSWAALIADYDLDGKPDIFISNGIKRRMNDLDYINYIASESIQSRLKGNMGESELALIDTMPVIKLPNYLYRNEGDLRFKNMALDWDMAKPSFSNGATYADLDNDGDLEIITNNLDDPAFLYKNLSREKNDSTAHYLKLRMKGQGGNTYGLGTRIMAYLGKKLILQELYSTRGFQSSVNPELILGLGASQKIDSLYVIWPDQSFQVLRNIPADQSLVVKQEEAKGEYSYSQDLDKTPVLKDLNEDFGIDYQHQENKFIEFNREALIPHMVSTEGPALAIGDVNGDGKEDFYVGGAKRQKGALYFQVEGGFELKEVPDFQSDSTAEDVEAQWVDIDQDQDLDLLVLAAGNEFYGKAEAIRPRLYKNDGKGNLDRDLEAFKGIYLNGGTLAIGDLNQDGSPDIFLGARVKPFNYGETPTSYLLLNDGQGNFKDISSQVPELQNIGMVTSAEWGDLNNDAFPELVLVGEWFPVQIFMNEKGKLKASPVKGTAFEFSAGFWNKVRLIDMDGDGDKDILAGNLGLNSKFQASTEEPLSLLLNDFDDNEKLDPLLFHYMQGKEYLFATKEELISQLPYLKKEYSSAQKFSQATINEIISPDKQAQAQKLQIYELRSAWFQNNASEGFTWQPLPQALQISPIYDFLAFDFNGDGQKDLLAGGNLYEVNIQRGRYDASYGTLLMNQGKGKYKPLSNTESGLYLEGAIRQLRIIHVGNKELILVGRNNAPLQFLDPNPQP